MRIILASKSPRRDEIFTLAGIRHEILAPDADESAVQYDGQPEMYVRALSRLKSDALWKMLGDDNTDDIISIAADTVVVSPDGNILGKPRDRDDAFRMLSLLSGGTHRVLTGVTMCKKSTSVRDEYTFAESTEVCFRRLDSWEISEYIDEEPPYDKAGAYGIQDGACRFAEKINGDFYNVVGLPVNRIYKILLQMGYKRNG